MEEKKARQEAARRKAEEEEQKWQLKYEEELRRMQEQVDAGNDSKAMIQPPKREAIVPESNRPPQTPSPPTKRKNSVQSINKVSRLPRLRNRKPGSSIEILDNISNTLSRLTATALDSNETVDLKPLKMATKTKLKPIEKKPKKLVEPQVRIKPKETQRPEVVLKQQDQLKSTEKRTTAHNLPPKLPEIKKQPKPQSPPLKSSKNTSETTHEMVAKYDSEPMRENIVNEETAPTTSATAREVVTKPPVNEPPNYKRTSWPTKDPNYQAKYSKLQKILEVTRHI